MISLCHFRKNNEAQVLGLPMYLIIVMIVAVAVIAAVVVMIPQGTQTMNAQVTSGSVQTEDAGGSAAELNFSGFSVTVKVTTNDDRHDPISGAIVRLSGGHAAQEATTDAQGVATLTFANGEVKLDANVNEAYMKMTAKASGYGDFEDLEAVLLYRG